MKCVILQPSYIPWRGYFHQIAKADVFVFYDDVQYDTRGWRNRNQIKTPQGLKWLTIPVRSKGAQTEHIPINQIPIVWEKPWQEEHLRTIYHAYRKAPYFDHFYEPLKNWMSVRQDYLADFTCGLTEAMAGFLGISGKTFLRSSSLKAGGAKTERLIRILKQIGADHYISGPSARDYIDPRLFDEAHITLEYMQYQYREYPQLYPPFEGAVSIIDLIFMTGPDAIDFIIN
jgi:hypothetical protein